MARNRMCKVTFDVRASARPPVIKYTQSPFRNKYQVRQPESVPSRTLLEQMYQWRNALTHTTTSIIFLTIIVARCCHPH